MLSVHSVSLPDRGVCVFCQLARQTKQVVTLEKYRGHHPLSFLCAHAAQILMNVQWLVVNVCPLEK